METTRLHDDDTMPADLSAGVEGFLDALLKAQTRFLQTLGQASAALGPESGQLANVAAVQCRLTRQFFDAQRLILTHRAQIDGEVAAIATAAAADATSLVASARVHPALAHLVVDDAELTDVSDVAAHPDLVAIGSSVRQEIAALGLLTMRTLDDAEFLANVIEDAFTPDEADGVVAQRQLATMLDDWWRAENQEGRAIVDDAHARAAVRRHVARIEALEILTGSPFVELETVAGSADPIADGASVLSDASAPRALPAGMLAALDAAEHDGLHSLFDSLSDSLQPTTDVALIHLDGPPAPVPLAEGGSASAFQHFWVTEPAAPAPVRSRDWFPTHVVLPITAVTSVIALLMAWIG
jgi:hypothetical protein